MRKWLKWICAIFLIPIVLLLLVSAFFYIPAVQDAAVKAGANYFSGKFGMKIELEKVRFVFPLYFSAQNVCAFGANNDTLLVLDKLIADVRLRPLLNGDISVKGLTLRNLKINSAELFNGMSIKGNVGEVHLKADSILLKKNHILINQFEMQNAGINIFLCDTTAKDTAKKPADWLIELGKVNIENVNFSCAMPCDSIFIDAEIKEVKLKDGTVDLGKGIYKTLAFNAEIAKLKYAEDMFQAKSGFDMSHIEFADIKLSSDSVVFAGMKDITASLKDFSAKERSGFHIKNMKANIVSDSLNIHVPLLTFQTEKSDFHMEANIPWEMIDNKDLQKESMSLKLNVAVAGQDIMFFVNNFLKNGLPIMYPDKKLTMNADITGNLKDMNINKLNVELSEHLKMNIEGNIKFPLKDSLRQGRFGLNINAQNIDFVANMMPSDVRERFRFPENITLKGNVTMNKGLYSTDLQFGEGEGTVKLSGKYDVFNESYDAFLQVENLQPVHFMPKDSLMFLSGSLSAAGKGTDIFNKQTRSEIKANVTDLQYANYSLTGISLTGTLKDRLLKAELVSDYPLAAGNVVFDGIIMKDDVKGNLTANIDTLDFKGLNFIDSIFTTSFRVVFDFQTNLQRKYSLDVTLGNWNLTYGNQQIRMDTMSLVFRCEEDTVKIDFDTGDLNLSLTGNADPMTLAGKFTKLSKEVMNQLARDSLIDMQALRPDFPDVTLHIGAERQNPVYKFLQEYNIFYETFSIDATVSPETGLNVDAILLSFVRDTFKIDTIMINVWQDMFGLRYEANVLKNRFRNQDPFKASANGYLYNKEADIFLSYINRYGEKGLNLGINMKKAPQGFDFQMYPEKIVLAFIPFTINKNNFFRFIGIKDMDADLYLKGNDNTSFRIHSDTTGSTASTKEIMVELNQIDIEKIAKGFTDFQSFRGILNATLKYQPTEKSYMIMADGNVDNLYYENGRIGEMLLNATYMPIDNNKQQIDFHAFYNMNEIASLSMFYTRKHNENLLDGVAKIDKLPLKMIEPFVPDNMVELNGCLQGDFNIGGTDGKPIVSGSLKPDSVSIFLRPSSTKLMLENKEIKMSNNIIGIDKFKVFSKKDFFVINGNINAENMNNPLVNLNVSGTNVPLVDTKYTPGCMVYGKLFVNLNTTITGTLKSPRTKGNLNILGNTNMTYMMPEETLDTQDEYNNMVKFTYFADTLPRQNRRYGNSGRPPGISAVTGNDVFLTIHIDPVVWFNIDMDVEKKNYVKLKGGGNLTLQYTSQGNVLLNGRYSLSDGNIKYNIPVIPSTEFLIRNGSYIDWSGDPMNPYLNITAYSQIRSSVKFDGQSRMVDFNAGIRINNYLDKVSAEFIVEAPNDVNVQNQLTAMGEAERSKQAISLLVAGVYLASGGTGTDNLDMNAALNSLLQRELRNLIGNFLGEVPFTFEVLTYDGLFGLGGRIDYIGRLHTTFFNNRLNSTIGLRFVTDDPVVGYELLLDDISFDYMLNTEGSRSVSLFRNKQYKNIFEGEVSGVGAGFTVRKKVKTLGGLFKLKQEL